MRQRDRDGEQRDEDAGAERLPGVAALGEHPAPEFEPVLRRQHVRPVPLLGHRPQREVGDRPEDREGDQAEDDGAQGSSAARPALVMAARLAVADALAEIEPGDGGGHQVGDHAERIGGAVVAERCDPVSHVDGDHRRAAGVDHHRHREHRQQRHEGQHRGDDQRPLHLRQDDLDQHAQAAGAEVARRLDHAAVERRHRAGDDAAPRTAVASTRR